MCEANPSHVEHVDERIDEAERVLLIDIFVYCSGKSVVCLLLIPLTWSLMSSLLLPWFIRHDKERYLPEILLGTDY